MNDAQLWVVAGTAAVMVAVGIVALLVHAVSVSRRLERLEAKAHWTPPPVPASVVVPAGHVDESPVLHLVDDTPPEPERGPGWVPATQPDLRAGDLFRL